MRVSKYFLSCMAILAFGATARADWDIGDPAKWVQLPDLTPKGMDVNATRGTDAIGLAPPRIILADDFLCTSTDAITDIHLWGSWKNDLLPQVAAPQAPNFVADPESVRFRLSIHADIPAQQNPLGFSKPGEELWSGVFEPGEFTARRYATDIEEGWLDPLAPEYLFPGDTVAWQYNFLIDEADAFIQQGTRDNPLVYWLDVHAEPINQNPQIEQPLFGWKTSADQFNDTAVYGPSQIANFPVVDAWTPITPPAMPGQPGDFNNDNFIDDLDIDLLRGAVISATSDPQFNVDGLNDPNIPDAADFAHLITSIIGTLRGDGDLNYLVNFADFVLVSNNFGMSGTNYIEGNYNVDNITNFEDFVFVANNFNMSAPRPPLDMAFVITPEPASGLLLLALAVVATARQKRLVNRRREISRCVTTHRMR